MDRPHLIEPYVDENKFFEDDYKNYSRYVHAYWLLWIRHEKKKGRIFEGKWKEASNKIEFLGGTGTVLIRGAHYKY